MHDLLEALEIAVVTIGFDESVIRALVDIAQRRDLELSLEFRRILGPAGIWVGLAAQRMRAGQETTDPRIDKAEAFRIGHVAALVRRALAIERHRAVGRGAEIARGEIGEQRLLARAAVAMTFVASSLAAEEIVAQLLFRR